MPYQSLTAVNTEELYGLFDTVAMTAWTEVPDMDLENAGLADSGTSVFLAYDAEQEQGKPGQPNPTESKIILIGKEDGAGNYYVAVDGADKVFTADKEMIDAVLNVEPYQYILKIPTLVSLKAVDEVWITGTEKEHVLRQEEDGCTIDGKDAKKEDFQKCYASLMDITVTGELPGDAEPEEEREAVLTICFDRKDDDAPDVEIKYYPYDETQMSACINGQERLLVDGDSVKTLKESLDRE